MALSNDSIPAIALEEHLSLPEMANRLAGKNDSRSPGSVKELGNKLADLTEQRLQSMDENNIDMQVLSVIGPGAQLLSKAEAPAFAAQYNDLIAQKISAFTDRFTAFAHLPMQAPAAAAEELERTAITYGFKGALINGLTEDKFLDDPSFEPLLEKAASLQLPLYLHPGLPPQSVADAYFAGLPKQAGNILSLAGWGWHAETALHILRLIITGTFDKYPNLIIIIGHMGEMLPVMMKRCDEILGTGQAGNNKRSISETLRDQVHITTSGIFTAPPFQAAVETFGIDNIMFSVDYPFARNESGRRFLNELPLSATDRKKLASDNARKILRLAATR